MGKKRKKELMRQTALRRVAEQSEASAYPRRRVDISAPWYRLQLFTRVSTFASDNGY